MIAISPQIFRKMIQAVIISTLIASASAFVPSAPRVVSSPSLLSSSEETEAVAFTPPPVKKARLMAKWLPASLKQKAPIALDGNLAGDVGFDPLGFSKSKKTLFWYVYRCIYINKYIYTDTYGCTYKYIFIHVYNPGCLLREATDRNI